MRGVILAGGLGTRLRPLTSVVNKHLLPVHDKPMLYYPLEMMAEAGIDEVCMVVGGHGTEAIIKLCKDGKQFGLKRLYYVYQEGEGGIAQALSLTEEFVGMEEVCVVLGDNIMLGSSLKPYMYEFERLGYGAMVLCATVSDPQNYGVPTIEKNGRLICITEKPERPMSKYGVIGVYFYDGQYLYDTIRKCKPSGRGELEITDVNNFYAEAGDLHWMEAKGIWIDAGSSIDALIRASTLVAEYNKKSNKDADEGTRNGSDRIHREPVRKDALENVRSLGGCII